MDDYGVSLNKHCPCTQGECPIRGNCVLCVQSHLDHGRHLPECMQEQLRATVKTLADQIELRTTDSRPDAAFWGKYDKENLVERSLARHAGQEGP